MKKKISLILICIVFLIKPMFAGGGSGSTAFQVLQIPMTAYEASLGNNYISDTSSCISNPSMIPFAPRSLILTHAVYLEDTNYSVAGFNLPLNNKSGLNISCVYFDLGSMTRTIDNGAGGYTEQGKFGANDKVFNISYGMEITESFSAGITAKYIKQTIDDVSYEGYAGHLSGMFFANECLYFGAGINNFGTQVAGYNLPTNLYLSCYGNINENTVLTAQMNEYFNDDIYELTIASEVNLENFLFFRIGYTVPLKKEIEDFTYEFVSNLTAGVGFRFDFLSLDYAWLPEGDLGNTHMFSLLVKF
ncbi:MAG: PorV/PorQ family protein [Endomicrobiaceae bacterium]